ncbi:hypothetical protein [Luteimicrobium subarcticum]|uniref:Uncharacterized protein n=1 Tax=Luteimicrobium subarcticum TaxID=620910 RepID=A0A2M8WT36_9MICO|nr:hypothetical protein [Luteimicrobium subarcticum]PJI94090.1 hypothetical protein CLV34_1576 [Luteimicrobium subarcticum]
MQLAPDRLRDPIPGAATGTTPESLYAQWQSFLTHDLQPLGQVALAALVVLAVIAGLARLLVIVAPDWPPLQERSRTATSAAVLALGSAALLTFGTAARGGQVVLAGIVLAAGAIVLGAWWLATRLRLTVTVTAPDGSDASTSSAHITALLADLGASAPRGLEVPRGSDVSSLAGVIGDLPQGKLAQLALGLVQAVLGSSPWRALVDIVDEDTLAVTVTRNGRQKGAAVVDRKVLDVGGDLQRFAAAAVMTAMARSYPDKFRGLCGTTDWRSLGLHYVATTDFQDDRDEQARILARALERDPGNWLAQLAYHNVTMRYTQDPAVLRAYRGWLTEVLAHRLDGDEYRSLALRAMYTRLSVDVNAAFARSSVGVDGTLSGVAFTPQDSEDAMDLVRRLAEIEAEATSRHAWWGSRPPRSSGMPAPALFDDLRGCAAPLVRLVVDRARYRPDDPDDPDDRRTLKAMKRRSGLGRSQRDGTLPDLDPESAADGLARSPKGYYTLACAIATYCDEPSTSMVDRAVGALRLAQAAPSLDAWMWHDPQLEGLRSTDEFRTAFGADRRTDLLGLPLLAPFADRLRGAALTSAVALRRTSARDLGMLLGAATAEVVAIQDVAVLAASLTDDDALVPWAVEVLHALTPTTILSTAALAAAVADETGRSDLVATLVDVVTGRTTPYGEHDAVHLADRLDRWTHRVAVLHPEVAARDARVPEVVQGLA